VLHALVVKHMLHGSSDALKKKYSCMIDGEYRFCYPWQLCEVMHQEEHSHSIYRRRADGCQVKIRGAELDNRWVVPYNPRLLCGIIVP
jgi:hypothetical protein